MKTAIKATSLILLLKGAVGGGFVGLSLFGAAADPLFGIPLSGANGNIATAIGAISGIILSLKA